MASEPRPLARKRPFLAFLLSYLLPGAGLGYLGMWRWAALNLAVVLLVGFLVALVLPVDVFDAWIRQIAIGIGGGSGGLAYALAKQRNQQVAQDAS